MTLPLRRAAVLLIGGLVLAHLALTVSIEGFDFTGKGQLSLFNLTHERSVGTWVNSALLGGAALAALAAAYVAARIQGRRMRNGWLALAGLIALMSLDEVAMMHEATIDLVQSSLELPAFLRFGWIIPALAIVAAFVVWQWRFLAVLPSWLRVRLAAAGAVYVAAAVGLEMVESQIANTVGEEEGRVVLQLLVGLEEGLEMGAAAAALLFILAHVARQADTWTVSLRGGAGAGATPSVHSLEVAASIVAEPESKGAGGQRGGAPALAGAANAAR